MRVVLWAGWGFLASFFSMGCAGPERDAPDELVGHAEEKLTGQELSQLLGMESTSFWSSTTATLSSSTTRVQGQFSLGVRGGGFHFVNSVPITAFTLQDNTVRFSLRLPSQQPNPNWLGDVQMYAEAPSVGIYNQYVGFSALTGRPLNQFFNVLLTLPPNVVQALSGPFNDLVIRLVLNVPSNATGTYLFDNLVFGGVDASEAPSPAVALLPEPSAGGSVLFLPLAPPRAGAAAVSQFSLNLGIQNNRPVPSVVDRVTVSFSGGAAVAPRTYPVGTSIPANSFGQWFFGITGANDNIFLPEPAQTQVTIQAFLQGFASPVSVTRPLAPHTPPIAGATWSWPTYSSDLRPGEYWAGLNGSHGAAGDGNQLYALDLIVWGFDSSIGQWSRLLPGTDGTQNDDYRVWGIPIRAMADGVVADFRDQYPGNPVPGQLLCVVDPTNTACPVPVEGNHFYIQHGDELMAYSHLQLGSLDPALKVIGAPVRKGQFLGLSGNSGNSSEPHLHIHPIVGTQRFGGPLRPMPFRNLHVVETTANTPPSPSAPWSFVNGRGLPREYSFVWPTSTHPNFRPLALGISRSGDWASRYLFGRTLTQFVTETQALFDQQGLRLIDATTYEENGVRKWAGVSRSGDWANWFIAGRDLATFVTETQALFDQQGLRLVDVDTYVEGGVRKWAGISRSGDWANVFIWGRDLATFLAETQQMFDEQGLRLVKAITYEEGGVRKWAGISRSGDWANIFTVGLEQVAFVAETQRLFDENGLRLVDVTSYVDGGVRKYAGISRSGDWANWFLIRRDLDQFLDDTQKLFDVDGLRMTHVEITGN